MEFALVSTLLLPLMFGIVDYGLWFSDSLSTRQAVREAARQGVVQTASCPGASSGLQSIACAAQQQAAPIAGTAWAKVVVPTGWVKAQPLLVCVMVKETGAVGLLPLPSDRMIRASTSMSIEVDTPVPAGSTAAGSTSAVYPATPAPGTWDFCAMGSP